MTPEEAKALLDAATPWPWEVRYTGIAFELSDGDTALIGDPADKSGHLIAAAPALAELVAGLRYEYAVQVKRDGNWVMEEVSYWGSYSVAAVRFGRTEEPARIVRRLAGDPEVIA